MANGLPQFCFSFNSRTNEVIIIRFGESGYHPITDSPNFNWVAENEKLGITPAQVIAMIHGSMFGWEVPGANPKEYINYISWEMAQV